MTSPDHELLEKFRTERHEPSFTELVNRHLGLVFSAAMRISCQPSLAEEVSQTVFTKLARLRSPLKGGVTLITWLHQTTRSASIDLLRAETRRRKREETAASLAAMSETTAHWVQIAPVLDEVIGRLSPDERHAVLCRYFEGQSYMELGRSLGLSEDAARMRVNRALEKIRSLLQKRGITTTASALALTLPAQAMTAMPSGLAASVSATALAASAAPLSITTIGIIAMTKQTTTIVAASVLFIAAAGTAVFIATGSDPSSKTVQTTSHSSAPGSDKSSATGEGPSDSRFRVRDRSGDIQRSAEEDNLISRYGESRVKMAKQITNKLLIGCLGEEGLAGMMPLFQQLTREETLSTLSEELKLTDEQKPEVEALMEKVWKQDLERMAATLDDLKANTLQIAEAMLAGDALKRGEISEQEYKDILGSLSSVAKSLDSMAMTTDPDGTLENLMANPDFSNGVRPLLDASQLALLEDLPHQRAESAPDDALVTFFDEAESLERMDETVTALVSTIEGLKRALEGVKVLEGF